MKIDKKTGRFLKENLLERFNRRVKKTNGCWEWIGKKDKDGYGRLAAVAELGTERANRIAYYLFNGINPVGLICHTCDNPSCVNPEHLYLGNHRDNAGDAFDRNRLCMGERVNTSKLTENQVKEIREKYSDRKTTLKTIGLMFGVSQTQVSSILNNKSWRYLH